MFLSDHWCCLATRLREPATLGARVSWGRVKQSGFAIRTGIRSIDTCFPPAPSVKAATLNLATMAAAAIEALGSMGSNSSSSLVQYAERMRVREQNDLRELQRTAKAACSTIHANIAKTKTALLEAAGACDAAAEKLEQDTATAIHDARQQVAAAAVPVVSRVRDLLEIIQGLQKLPDSHFEASAATSMQAAATAYDASNAPAARAMAEKIVHQSSLCNNAYSAIAQLPRSGSE